MSALERFVRSGVAVSAFGLYALTTFSLLTVVCLWIPRRWLLQIVSWIAMGHIKIDQWAMGSRLEIRRTHPLPTGPVIYAFQHQSSWEAGGCMYLCGAPVVPILKRELLYYFPFLALPFKRYGILAVNRAAGERSLMTLIRQARGFVADGRSLFIFPQGTRVPYGQTVPLLPGIASLYARLKIPCVPVAVNSGLFWPRRRFLRRQGLYIVEFREPISPGMSPKTFLKTLEARLHPLEETS